MLKSTQELTYYQRDIAQRTSEAEPGGKKRSPGGRRLPGRITEHKSEVKGRKEQIKYGSFLAVDELAGKRRPGRGCSQTDRSETGSSRAYGPATCPLWPWTAGCPLSWEPEAAPGFPGDQVCLLRASKMKYVCTKASGETREASFPRPMRLYNAWLTHPPAPQRRPKSTICLVR